MLRIHISNSGTFHTTYIRALTFNRDFPVYTLGGRKPTFRLGTIYGHFLDRDISWFWLGLT